METTRNLLLAAILIVGLSAAPQASALPGYNALDLGIDGWYYWASAMNNKGQVVGLGFTDGGGFITGPNGVGLVSLGFLPGPGFPYASAGSDINEAGQVAGTSWRHLDNDYIPSAFITGPNGIGITDIGALPGFIGSDATAVNDSGQIVGTSKNGNVIRAFITGPNGQNMAALGTAEASDNITPTDINNSGQVSGYIRIPSTNTIHAFITGPNGASLIDIGGLPGAAISIAIAINDDGRIAGNSGNHAFMTGPDGQNMFDLGMLSEDSFMTSVGDMNASGQVVGTSYISSSIRHAFITDADGANMTDLNTLVSLSNDGYFDDAIAINDSGQVVASAHFSDALPARYYLLTPVPVPIPASAWLFSSAILLGLRFGRYHRSSTQVARL